MDDKQILESASAKLSMSYDTLITLLEVMRRRLGEDECSIVLHNMLLVEVMNVSSVMDDINERLAD